MTDVSPVNLQMMARSTTAAMATFTFELKQGNGKREERPLQLRITVNRQHSRIATDYAVRPDTFDSANPDHPLLLPKRSKEPTVYQQRVIINTELRALRAKAILIADQAARAGESLTAGELRARIKGIDKPAKSQPEPEPGDFLAFTRLVITRRAAKKRDVRTIERYQSYLAKLRHWLGERKLTFRMLDEKGALTLLLDYKTWLLTAGKKGKAGWGPLDPNSVSKAIQFWRGVAKDAVDEELLTRNLFSRLEVEFTEPEIAHLTEDEVALFRQVPIENSLQQLARAIWLFQFNQAGRRVGDVLAMRWRDITPGGEHGTWRATAQKTGKAFVIDLTEESAFLIDRYRRADTQPDHFVFPMISNTLTGADPKGWVFKKALSSATAQLNARLPLIAKKAGLTQHVSTHVARHSFANMAINKGISIYELCEALEHSSVKVTERYVKRFGSEAANKVIRRVHTARVVPSI